MSKKTKHSARKRPKRLRVFIVGAGMSAACGIPVAKDLLRAAMFHLAESKQDRANHINELLKYLYPAFDPDLRNYPNIEDFLNLLEMAIRFNSEEFIKSDLWPKAKLSMVRRSTLKAVTDFLWHKMQNKERFQTIREFVGQAVKRGDVIITFNWDVSVEHALHLHPDEPSFDYLFKPENGDVDVFLLKPHGSIDWFRRKQLPSRTKDKDVIKLDETLCVFPFFDFKRNPSLSSKPPVIVPPISSKDFSEIFLKKTWASVYKAVSRASELHIIGYSLPQEDQFSRLVLRRAIRNNLLRAKRKQKFPLRVTVVNPDPVAMVTFSKLFGTTGDGMTDLRFEQSYFEDYAEKFNKTSGT